MRLFLALAFEGEPLVRLMSAAESVRKPLTEQGWRILPPENWHLTLIFFGEVTPERAEQITLAVRAMPVEPLILPNLRWGSPGSGNPLVKTFGWLVGPSLELIDFRIAVANRTCGSSDRRRFQPHITMARRRDMALRPTLNIPLPDELRPAKLTLFQSELLASGAKHMPLVERPLS